MTKISLRWALPVFHLAMDAVLVAILIVQIQEPGYVGSNNGEMVRVFNVQEDRPVPRFDDIRFHSRPAFDLLVSSTLPAGLASGWALSNTGFNNGPAGWRWLALYEGIAVPFWFLLGWIADRGRIAVSRWCLALVAIRLLDISLVVSIYRDIGLRIQVLFWLAATICLFLATLWRLARRIGYGPGTTA